MIYAQYSRNLLIGRYNDIVKYIHSWDYSYFGFSWVLNEMQRNIKSQVQQKKTGGPA